MRSGTPNADDANLPRDIVPPRKTAVDVQFACLTNCPGARMFMLLDSDFHVGKVFFLPVFLSANPIPYTKLSFLLRKNERNRPFLPLLSPSWDSLEFGGRKR